MEKRTSVICFFLIVCLVGLNTTSTNANTISGDNIPLVEYHPDTGLLLLDTDGFDIAMASVGFRDRESGGIGYETNNFFNNSTDNPLFADYGGVITEWTSGWNGEDIYGQMPFGQTYSGSLRA